MSVGKGMTLLRITLYYTIYLCFCKYKNMKFIKKNIYNKTMDHALYPEPPFACHQDETDGKYFLDHTGKTKKHG